ncbi:MAG: methylated-DNA--[protein]-cysteine S-methyltransferase [Brevundimonas sp.]|jgi:methylated-DNA-[protein]-cysteine S-methyltransferase|uniref:methylated-DNA--[protein]-cysteine S-methyltransferase n=1 Tax=Brevundimonas sp. TaxID=1871086 RepID=UPI004033370F
MIQRLTTSTLPSPVGLLAIATDEQGRLRGVSFGDSLSKAMRREYPRASFLEGETPAAVRDGIDAYFAGDMKAFARIPWTLEDAAADGGFQARVWVALSEVPAGTTITYGEMAKRAGEAGAAQAAGVALNRNPIPLVLPCHRVIGADGAMVGFGGGLERKTWLLRHEGAILI